MTIPQNAQNIVTNNPILLILIDFQKAFDSVLWLLFHFEDVGNFFAKGKKTKC